MPDIAGVLSALVTPFTGPEAELDAPGLRELVDRSISEGVHGLVPCGSTGEFAAMGLDERRTVVEVVIDQARGRVPVIAHVGAMTTKDAVGLARHAEAHGAAAVMAVAPYYEPLSVTETKHYFQAVAGAISIPVILYNLPVATGVNLPPNDVADLARSTENIRYVKDTTGDLSQAARLIHGYGARRLGSRHSLYRMAGPRHHRSRRGHHRGLLPGLRDCPGRRRGPGARAGRHA